VEQAHAREARLGDLRGADRVIGARGLASALRVEPCIALAEPDEIRLHPIGDAEIEMPAMDMLEEARGAEVFVVAARIDIGPELARRRRHIRLARQIFAALNDWRSKTEIEAEQGRLSRSPLQKPIEHFLTGPGVAGADKPRRGLAAGFSDRDSLVSLALRARPIDRDV